MDVEAERRLDIFHVGYGKSISDFTVVRYEMSLAIHPAVLKLNELLPGTGDPA
jgi:hypothetical protein